MMPETQKLTPDTIVQLLLCTRLSLKEDLVKTFSPKEWKHLVEILHAAGHSPRVFLENSVSDFQDLFSDSEIQINRIGLLVSRRFELENELDRLSRLGIHVLTQQDADYPSRYFERLKEAAPQVLFYAGEAALLGQPGIAVVGSRNLEEVGQACARYVGSACGLSGLVLYSGGAKGVDSLSMESALDVRGTAVGVLADDLELMVRKWQPAIKRKDLCLVSPYHPQAGFSVGAAMGRNRLIYTLADFGVIVASEVQKGGTWAGAVENLKHHWVPLFVLSHNNMPSGNSALLTMGGIGLPYPFPTTPNTLLEWLTEKSEGSSPLNQLKLF